MANVIRQNIRGNAVYYSVFVNITLQQYYKPLKLNLVLQILIIGEYVFCVTLGNHSINKVSSVNTELRFVRCAFICQLLTGQHPAVDSISLHTLISLSYTSDRVSAI